MSRPEVFNLVILGIEVDPWRVDVAVVLLHHHWILLGRFWSGKQYHIFMMYNTKKYYYIINYCIILLFDKDYIPGRPKT